MACKRVSPLCSPPHCSRRRPRAPSAWTNPPPSATSARSPSDPTSSESCPTCRIARAIDSAASFRRRGASF
ncbi:MAG: hypothetical protein EKK29_16710 [Hyphomicrobiales bacterium]|nr:MAG: hypothetical protein EKK29_16710 [Hyphomicrobiales bacterium]